MRRPMCGFPSRGLPVALRRRGSRSKARFRVGPGWWRDRRAGTIQSGTQGSAPAQTPIWEHGLRGEGQIVGLIDTGVDADACYFGDPRGLPPTNTWSQEAGYGTTVDGSQRKIVGYDFLF